MEALRRVEEEEEGGRFTFDVDVVEAVRILESASPLEGLKPYLDAVIAGEDVNKQVTFLLLLSGRVRDPRRKQLIILAGEPGAGKTTVANNLSRLFRTKKVARFSKRGLDYVNLRGYDVLYLQEMGDLDRGEQGISMLKFLSADDRGYTIEVTTYDKGLEAWSTVERTIPPMTVITCVAKVDVEDQFRRRAWVMNVDESVEQTRRVRAYKAGEKWEENWLSLGLIGEAGRDRAFRVLRAVVDQLEPVEVFLPFPRSIFSILRTSRVRVRGDYDKLWTLAWLQGFLMQRRLPVISNRGGRKTVLASAIAIAKLLTLAKVPLTVMSTGIEPRFKALFQAMRKLGITRKGMIINLEDRGRLARQAGQEVGTIRVYLAQLAKLGYFIRRKEGSSVTYVLPEDLTSILRGGDGAVKVLEDYRELAGLFLTEAKCEVDEQLKSGALRGDTSQDVAVLKRIRRRLCEEEATL